MDVVWLSPIYRSPQDDNGYDISDYQDVDPTFGTLADLDELLDGTARARHAADDGPRRQPHQRRAPVVRGVAVVDRTTPKRDWYWWRPPRDGMAGGAPGAEPTNWESVFSGPAWAYDEASGEYYLHLFSRKQPDLNWENPEVREAVYAMMRWWLDRGVDGFRMDVINLISKDPSLPDGIVHAGSPGRRDALRHERPAHPRVPRRDAPRGPRGPGPQDPHRRGDAGRHDRAGAALHRPRPRARWTWSSPSSTSASTTRTPSGTWCRSG